MAGKAAVRSILIPYEQKVQCCVASNIKDMPSQYSSTDEPKESLDVTLKNKVKDEPRLEIGNRGDKSKGWETQRKGVFKRKKVR